MTAGAATPPEHPPRRTHPDSGDGGKGDGGGKNGVGGGSSTGRGITTYDADGDHRRRHCPRGAATADVMMTMAGKRGGEAIARQRRGDGDGNNATMKQQGCEGNRLWRRRWQGQQGNRQEESNYIMYVCNLPLLH